MTIDAKGQHGGNAAEYCEELKLSNPETWDEARDLALLNRVLGKAETRDRLLDMAERIEAEDLAAAEAAPN